MSRSVAIAIHDVSPHTLELCQRLVATIEATVGAYVPMTLLIVPTHHRRGVIHASPALRRWVDSRLERGDEAALHGFCHLDEAPPPRTLASWWRRRALTDGEGEFAALGFDEARERIEQGLAAFAACNWRAHGFVPPAWQLNDKSQRAIESFPFEYFTTHNAFTTTRPRSQRNVPALSLSARSNWRRRASVTWAEYWLRSQQQRMAWRFALHPVDACHEHMLAIWQKAAGSALQARAPVTKRQLAQQFQRESSTNELDSDDLHSKTDQQLCHQARHSFIRCSSTSIREVVTSRS